MAAVTSGLGPIHTPNQQDLNSYHIGRIARNAVVSAVAVAAIGACVAFFAGFSLTTLPVLAVITGAALVCGIGAALISRVSVSREATLRKEVSALCRNAKIDISEDSWTKFWEMVTEVNKTDPKVFGVVEGLINAVKDERVQNQRLLNGGCLGGVGGDSEVANFWGQSFMLAPSFSDLDPSFGNFDEFRGVCLALSEMAILANTQILEKDLIPAGHLISDGNDQEGIKETQNVKRFWLRERDERGSAKFVIRHEFSPEIKSYWKIGDEELVTTDQRKRTLVDRSLTFEVKNPKIGFDPLPIRKYEVELGLEKITKILGDKVPENMKTRLLDELFHLLSQLQASPAFATNDNEGLLAIVEDWAPESGFEFTATEKRFIFGVLVTEFLVPAYHNYMSAVANYN